jgi:hypothetical protein
VQEVIHNRTVNINGGKGKNIPMDRQCEHFNKDFKGIAYIPLVYDLKLTHHKIFTDTSKNSGGQLTDATVQRAGKMAGALGRTLETVFQENFADGASGDAGHTSRKDFADDISDFVKEYKKERLFDVIPGRHHKSFPSFNRFAPIDEPGKLKALLIKPSKKLDWNRRPVRNLPHE